jgi:hypothetical protein
LRACIQACLLLGYFEHFCSKLLVSVPHTPLSPCWPPGTLAGQQALQLPGHPSGPSQHREEQTSARHRKSRDQRLPMPLCVQQSQPRFCSLQVCMRICHTTVAYSTCSKCRSLSLLCLHTQLELTL